MGPERSSTDQADPDFRTMKSDQTIGTVAWITGAGKGIGRALALRLAEEGILVAASARTLPDLESLVKESDTRPGQIVAFPLDVTDETAVVTCANQIETSLGKIDLLICNAGAHVPLTVSGFNSETFRYLFDVNVMGTVYGLAALLPRFIKRRKGRIAVMSSVAAYRGLPSAAAYGATKAALINMCEALKPEADKFNIGLSVICPGFVKTPLTDRNSFRMPFLMDADRAADKIFRGLQGGQFEISFPRRLTIWFKLSRCLPYRLFFLVTSRMTSSNESR